MPLAKSKYIYIIAPYSFFNPEEAPVFEGLDGEHSLQLYRNLLINYTEILRSLSDGFTAVYCLDERDSAYIPDELKAEQVEFYKYNSAQLMFNRIAEKHLPYAISSLFISADTIAVSAEEIKKIFELLEIEEKLILIGDSKNGKLVLSALNYSNVAFLKSLNVSGEDFDSALKKACSYDNTVQRSRGYLKISGLNDFKELYKELSKKESWAYCSETMHEKFTNLFIEYKDLLK